MTIPSTVIKLSQKMQDMCLGTCVFVWKYITFLILQLLTKIIMNARRYKLIVIVKINDVVNTMKIVNNRGRQGERGGGEGEVNKTCSQKGS